jgi:hypothetical protein
LIHQCIGRVSLGTVIRDAETLRGKIVELLFAILRDLLPSSEKQRIEIFVTRIVDNTISLKNAMTTEQAVYRSIFPNYGDEFDERIAQTVSGEDHVGRVMICTFPGLSRFTVHMPDESDRSMVRGFLTVVKAEVKLEGVFRKKALTNEFVETMF